MQEALAAGYDTVVAAAGSIEQHGPHLPLVTDTLIGGGLIAAVVERLDGALQGPTIPFGCSEHHMAFPGTITLEKETFKNVVKEYARSLGRHGFRTVYVVPSHGGNFAPLREAVDELEGRAGSARVVAYSDLPAFLEVIYASQRPYDVTPAVAGAHAGNTETALVLALRPELVRMEHAEAGFTGELQDAIAGMFAEGGVASLSPIGAIGDPARASAEHGERYWSLTVELALEQIEASSPTQPGARTPRMG